MQFKKENTDPDQYIDNSWVGGERGRVRKCELTLISYRCKVTCIAHSSNAISQSTSRLIGALGGRIHLGFLRRKP